MGKGNDNYRVEVSANFQTELISLVYVHSVMHGDTDIAIDS